MIHQHFFRSFAVLSLLLSGTARANAADYPIKITSVKVGLPPGPFSKHVDENGQPQYLFKAGMNAPLYVDIKAPTWFDPDKAPTWFSADVVVDVPDGEGLMVRSRRSLFITGGAKVQHLPADQLPTIKPGGTTLPAAVLELLGKK